MGRLDRMSEGEWRKENREWNCEASSILQPPSSSLHLPPSQFLGAIAALLLAALPALGQEIHWRYDYNSARRESQQKQKPLLIDFATDNCFWCVKLDTTTFHEPAIVAIVNEHFIPLKQNQMRNPTLAEYLRIQSFPTVVLADPEGKILATLEGYMEANRFNEHVQRALATLSNPEWMVRDFQLAEKAYGESEYARALEVLRSIIEDGRTRPIQLKARQVLKEIDARAEQRLIQARKFQDQGRTSEAIDVMVDLMKRFPGTHAAGAAEEMVKRITTTPDLKAKQRTDRARELLAQAREDFKLQHYLWCLDRCDNLINNYFDMPEGAEALQLANEIKGNPDWMRQACESLGERLGLLYLALAETYLKKGQPQQAMICLEHVITTLPGSRQAEIAQDRLAQIQGKSPNQQIKFKRP